jgi:hypothetical protein
MTADYQAEQGKKIFATAVLFLSQGLSWFGLDSPGGIFTLRQLNIDDAFFRAEIVIGAIVAAYGILVWRSASRKLVTETVEIPRYLRSTDHYLFPTPVGKPYLRVAIDSHATEIQRQHAFDFSFLCLVKPGTGCDLPCDYLPSAWEDWTTGWSEQDFLGHYTQHARCKK